MLIEKIEIGFDLTSTGAGPFLVLDDPVQGKLDDPEWVLGGNIFIDVTDRVRSYSITRGKSRELDRYNAGVCSVTFSNFDRAFDPTYTSSPFYGQVIPHREIRVTVDGVVQFKGRIDDWNLDWTLEGDASASLTASDGFMLLAGQTLTGGVQTSELSGARVNDVLSSADVNWPVEERDIDSGQFVLGADTVAPDTSALSYLQLIEQSEFGRLFVSKTGKLTFRDFDGVAARSSDLVVFADDNSGIDYSGVAVTYGSELLYNQAVVSSVTAASTAIADDLPSQDEYGISTLTQTDLLLDSVADIESRAYVLVSKYSEPEFRFDTIEVNLTTLSEAEQTQVLALEMGSVCQIKFTPGGISPAIEKYAEVIGIGHQTDLNVHKMSFSFQTLDSTFLVLDDAVFGRLDYNTLS